ncbi:MAG: type II toxin-antitoxin system VapB family antitoxin [Rhizobiaceae bacterium]
MVIHVKDEETDALVRRLAQSRGIGITTAIKEAVRAQIEADAARPVSIDDRSLEERLKPLLDRLDRLPRTNLRTDKAFFDDVWGEADS